MNTENVSFYRLQFLIESADEICFTDHRSSEIRSMTEVQRSLLRFHFLHQLLGPRKI
jgi:hypothetical protein